MRSISFLLILALSSFLGGFVEHAEAADKFSITIVYDNYQYKENTISDWGFACFIEGTEKTILFDTGSQGSILMSNIDSLGIDLNTLDLVVISHNHGDHTGGLHSVFKKKSDLPVYFGESFPVNFSQNILNQGSTPVRVNRPIEICDHVYSTGELKGTVNEQSLIIDSEKGLIIITGCSHPGIINILRKAREIFSKHIYLVFGGFHLIAHSDAQVNQIIQEFRELGVEKCGATHCTGQKAINLFKQAYGDNYVPMGVGKVISGSIETIRIK